MTASPIRAAALAALLAVLLAAWSPAQAQTQPAVWSADQEVDLEMGAFEDPSLLFALTERPDPERRLELFQPFDQQPPAALSDFSPAPPEPGPPCVPGANRVCP